LIRKENHSAQIALSFLLAFVVLTALTVDFGSLHASDSQIEIVAGGDVMLGSWAQETILRNGWDYPFQNLDTLLNRADIVFANLEAPFGTGGKAFEKQYSFRVAPDLVNVLKAGRINMINLANNHIMDFGPDVLKQTIALLGKNHIKYSGAGSDLQKARLPAQFEIKGTKIAFLCYSLTFPEEFWATDTSAGTGFPYDTFFFDDVRKLKRENDLVIVSFHWGGELLKSPKPYQVRLAHQTINAGADIILGHHPHVVQGIEVYHNKIIAYSLGNFVFGSFSENVRDSMLLKIYYGTNGIVKCKINPIFVYNKEVEFQPRMLSGAGKVNFIKELQNISQELNGSRNVISSAGWIQL